MSGQVTNISGGAGVSGGTIQLLRGGSVIDTDVPDGSGNYSFSSAQASDVVRNQPKGSMCCADAGEFTVSSVPSTIDFEVQASTWFDDFQSYDADGDFNVAPGSASGKFFWNGISGGNAGGHDGVLQWTAPTSDWTLETTGPAASKVMRATWNTSRPTCPGGNCANCTAAQSLYVRFNKYGAFGDELWFSFYQLESSDFVVGSDICFGSSRELKYLIVDFNTNPYGNVQQLWLELEDPTSNPASPDAMKLRIKLTTNSGSTVVAETTGGGFGGDYSLGAGWVNQFHRWTVGITGVQDAEQYVYIYLDDVLTRTLNGAWLTGRDYQHADALIAFQWGYPTINNGPTTGGMYRDFREFIVSPGRCTTIDGLAV